MILPLRRDSHEGLPAKITTKKPININFNLLSYHLSTINLEKLGKKLIKTAQVRDN